MLTEQALPHVEVRYLSHRMYPADLIEGLFDTVSGLCIIAHNLASTDISADINLPEYAWLSSARVVRCWVKSRNERNPCH